MIDYLLGLAAISLCVSVFVYGYGFGEYLRWEAKEEAFYRSLHKKLKERNDG